eukprot:2199084-Rhodomonas_salina.2
MLSQWQHLAKISEWVQAEQIPEAKFLALEQHYQDQLDGGDLLPDSDVDSEEEMECSPGTLCVETVHAGQYLDDSGQCMYMCKVGIMDEEGRHNGVAWKVKEHDIHKKTQGGHVAMAAHEVEFLPFPPAQQPPLRTHACCF